MVLLAAALPVVPALLLAASEVQMPPNLRSVSVSASSTRAGKTLDAYAAWKVLDGNAETVWCEGKGDAGAGESVTLTFPDAVRVDEIAIVTGIPATPELFDANNVPSTIEVTTDDGRSVEGMDGSLVEGAFDYTGTASVELGPPAVHKLVLKIGAVEKVTAPNHTCIADVRIRSGADDVEPILGVDNAGIAALPRALDGLVQAFATCDGAKLAANAQFPLPFDFLQEVPPSAQNGFLRGVKPVRATWRAATDLAAKCAAKDPLAPSVGEVDAAGLLYTARSAGPGELVFRVDSRDGDPSTWRLVWRDKRWKLVGISRIPE